MPFNDGPTDMGAEAFLARRRDAVEFIESLGLGDSLVEPSGLHSLVYSGELLPAMSEAGSEVMGVDYRVPMDAAAERVSARVLQGNLDPAMLFAGDDAVRQAVRTIRGEVDRARERGDIDGHIWNLGHGVLPTTDAEAITRAVSIIHEEG